jgi:hypothetical protein
LAKTHVYFRLRLTGRIASGHVLSRWHLFGVGGEAESILALR